MFTEFFVITSIAFIIFLSVFKRNASIPKKHHNIFENSKIKEIQYQGRLYDVTHWAKKHPGGAVIEFYVNNKEDATLAIQQFHHRSAKRVSAMLHSFKSRPAYEKNPLFESSLKYEELTKDFCSLYKELDDEGLFDPDIAHVTIRILELLFLGTVGLYFACSSESILTTAVGILILNSFGMRAQFFMHEAGHHSMTGRPGLDRVIESIAVGLSSGLSGSFWRNQHNKHHAMPQRLQHDIDLRTLPLIAFHTKVLQEGTKPNFAVQNQATLFVPVFATLGYISWKIHLHPVYAFKKKQYYELVLMALHYYAAYYVGFFPYLVLLLINSSAMLINFSVSHSHLPVAEEPRHWVEYSTVHTMNVNPSWWCDWWMGYLNYQIEHHLFPTLPQFRLRAVGPRVRALAMKYNLPYTCVSYGAALTKMFRNLSTVSHDLQMQAKL